MPRFVSDDRFASPPDFRLGDSAADFQRAPVFAAVPGGGFLAIWTDSMVRGQFFDRNGREVGAELVIGAGFYASVAALASGGFAVTWAAARPYPSNEDIVVQILDAAGARVGPEIDVNSVTEARQENPMVAALAGGGFVVTWETPFGQGFDNIRAQLFAADGTKIGSEIVANDSVQGSKYESDVIALAGGGFLVAWFQPSADSDFSPGVRAQLFDATGTKVGAAFSLNPSTPGEQAGPDLAALPGGGFVAAWSDNGNPFMPDPHPENKGIWLQIFDAAGAKVGAAVHVSTLGPIGQGTPEVEAIPGVGIIVTWVDGNTTAENGAGHLRAQMFDFAGNKTGAEFAIDPGGSGQLQIDLTVLTTGAFVVGWTQRVAPQFNDEDVRASLFFPTINGTGGNDSFAGTPNRDFYLGQGGDDQLSGAGEEDGLSGGDGNDMLNGDAGDDDLAGDDGNDVLDGGGGVDSMAGGLGNDVFYVDSAGDVVSEAAGEGADTIYTSASYTLAAGAEVETLSVLDANGTGAINLTGNAFANALIGNAGANVLDGGAGADSLQGRSGNDLYLVDDAGDTVVELAGEGTDEVRTALASYSLAGTEVENLTGLGTGNQSLAGNSSANIIDGGAGADTMAGGLGNDVYIVDNAGDVTTELAGEGIDEVRTSLGSYSLAGTEVENLTGTGNVSQTLSGNAAANAIDGGGGNDILIGGGNDALTGGSGNDTFYVAGAGDTVGEAAGQGTDRIATAVSYTLAAGSEVEQLEAINSAGTDAMDLTGNAFANTITGNAGVNILRGDGGSDILGGLAGNDFLVGGAGADFMYGGTGDDTYYVDDAGDQTSEQASEGTDRIATSISYALLAGSEIELLEGVNTTDTNAIDLTGSDFANTIIANNGVNLLRGRGGNDVMVALGGNDFLDGGTGADLMYGGTGDDTYYVDSLGDQANEAGGEGTDRIATSISFALQASSEVELLESVNSTDTVAMDLTGSDSANQIIGNNGVNVLRGEGGNDILIAHAGDDFLVGGAGNDAMNGGLGNDTYYVDSALDTVVEAAGQGNDRIATSVGYTLAAGSEIETLEAITRADTSAMNLTGNAGANTIVGNDGANILDGKGGNDLLVGYGGADTFQYTSALGSGNVGRIANFESGTDKIALDDAVFTGLGLGALSANAFVIGSQAQDADDRIVFNNITGQLYFDADGNGAGAQVLFGVVVVGNANAGDFIVI